VRPHFVEVPTPSLKRLARIVNAFEPPEAQFNVEELEDYDAITKQEEE